jgi:Tol biopolymer transport system component
MHNYILFLVFSGSELLAPMVKRLKRGMYQKHHASRISLVLFFLDTCALWKCMPFAKTTQGYPTNSFVWIITRLYNSPMNRISHLCLVTSFLFLFSCTPTPQTALHSSLIMYRFDPPAFLEFSEDFQLTKEIPFSIPPNCGLFDTFPAPIGGFLLIELNCPNGQTVLFLNTVTASVSQPVNDSDSHFLAWTGNGEAAFLKVDSLGSPQIVHAQTDGKKEFVPITEFTYDLSTKSDSRDFTFTFSRGLGYGSELYLAKNDGRITQLLYADLYNYISYARFSPNGKQIAFIKIPDTQTPFTVGELWVIPSTVTFTNKTPSSQLEGIFLSNVDTGHGYAANWSPDGTRIAFVRRENPKDESADQSSDALISNIYVVDVISREIAQVTNFDNARAETPYWSAQGNILTFNVVLNGRMQVYIADTESGEIQPLETGSTCCPAWMRK